MAKHSLIFNLFFILSFIFWPFYNIMHQRVKLLIPKKLITSFWRIWSQVSGCHYVKSVLIRSYSGPYFPAFGLNTKRYGVSLRIQSECGKIQTRITPNTDTFYAVFFYAEFLLQSSDYVSDTCYTESSIPLTKTKRFDVISSSLFHDGDCLLCKSMDWFL